MKIGSPRTFYSSNADQLCCDTIRSLSTVLCGRPTAVIRECQWVLLPWSIAVK